MSKAVVSAAPCAKCPFRKDVPIFLRAGRRQEIVRSIAIDQQTFHCHATVDYSDEDGPSTAEAAECAGALKAVMMAGGTTQHARMAERLGLVDLDTIEEHPVEVWSLDDWVRLKEGSTGDAPIWIDEEIQTCNTVGPNCIAPAGFLGAGGAVVSGTEAADEECEMCGEPVCSECVDSAGLCGMCSDEDEED